MINDGVDMNAVVDEVDTHVHTQTYTKVISDCMCDMITKAAINLP